jgi:hypothetical protein
MKKHNAAAAAPTGQPQPQRRKEIGEWLEESEERMRRFIEDRQAAKGTCRRDRAAKGEQHSGKRR